MGQVPIVRQSQVGRKRGRRWGSTPALSLLAIPAVVYLAIMFAVPLALLLVSSLRTEAGVSVANYAAFFSDAFHWRVIWNTLSLAAVITLVALLLGYPTAFALARARGLVQILLLVAMILPLSVGVVVKAFSWQIVLRSDGVFNQTLLWLGLVDEPIRFLFTRQGLVLGAVNIFIPFMVLPIYSVVKLIDPAISSAATTLGAGPVYRFLHVTLPLSLPGVIAGIAFVFSFAIAMYVIPTLLVGDQLQTLSTLIGRAYLLFRDQSLGSTVAVVLLIIAVAVVLASGVLARRVSVRS